MHHLSYLRRLFFGDRRVIAVVAWRAHMDDQAEEDLHHEDASSIDSVDSTPTGSVDSGRSTASRSTAAPLLLPGVDGWFAIYASKPSGNVNWMLRGATDLPLLSRRGDVDNGTLQPFARQPWPPSKSGGRNRCNWRWMHCINPRNWHYQTQTTSIFSRLDPCKTHLRRRCGLQHVPCCIEGSTMNLGYGAGHIRPCSLPWKR